MADEQPKLVVPVGGVGGVGSALPDLKHLEQKDLLERLAQATRELKDERLKFDRQLQVAQTQAKVDIERLRATTAVHVRELEAQVSALLKSLSRLQADVERLERENLTLRVMAGNGHAELPVKAPAGQAT